MSVAMGEGDLLVPSLQALGKPPQSYLSTKLAYLLYP
jgi:hypothetical protein